MSADHGGLPVSIDFKGEERRTIGRIHDKTPKLAEDKITLVALDCTAIPEHGSVVLGIIPDALSHIFGQDNSELGAWKKGFANWLMVLSGFRLTLTTLCNP
jgi:hypothetical protein